MQLIAEENPKVADPITKQSYVDDLRVQGFNKAQCKQTKADVIEVLGKHSIYLKGWGSNGESPDEEVSSSGGMSYLGITWFPESDEFSINIPKLFKGIKKKGQTERLIFWEGQTSEDLMDFLEALLTLRDLLSRIMGYYDSTGLLSPLLCALHLLILI